MQWKRENILYFELKSIGSFGERHFEDKTFISSDRDPQEKDVSTETENLESKPGQNADMETKKCLNVDSTPTRDDNKSADEVRLVPVDKPPESTEERVPVEEVDKPSDDKDNASREVTSAHTLDEESNCSVAGLENAPDIEEEPGSLDVGSGPKAAEEEDAGEVVPEKSPVEEVDKPSDDKANGSRVVTSAHKLDEESKYSVAELDIKDMKHDMYGMDSSDESSVEADEKIADSENASTIKKEGEHADQALVLKDVDPNDITVVCI